MAYSLDSTCTNEALDWLAPRSSLYVERRIISLAVALVAKNKPSVDFRRYRWACSSLEEPSKTPDPLFTILDGAHQTWSQCCG